MIKIITDSTAYIKKQEAIDASIKIIPMSYTVNGKTYYESFPDNNGDFESLLKTNSSFTTSQPDPAAFLSAFEEELILDNEVLCITMSSRLSGTYSAAYMAAKQTGSEKIHIFDSRLSVGGLYLLVHEAKKLIDENKNINEIIKALTGLRDKITVAFSVDDMTPLRKSRRIGFVRLSVGTILNKKPILLCNNGVVVYDSVARGSTEIIKKLVEKIPPSATKAVVSYIENSSTASNLYNIINAKYPNIQVQLQKLGPVMGIHLGLKVIVVSFITE